MRIQSVRLTNGMYTIVAARQEEVGTTFFQLDETFNREKKQVDCTVKNLSEMKQVTQAEAEEMIALLSVVAKDYDTDQSQVSLEDFVREHKIIRNTEQEDQ